MLLIKKNPDYCVHEDMPHPHGKITLAPFNKAFEQWSLYCRDLSAWGRVESVLRWSMITQRGG